jgi:hypothetical protein
LIFLKIYNWGWRKNRWLDACSVRVSGQHPPWWFWCVKFATCSVSREDLVNFGGRAELPSILHPLLREFGWFGVYI